MQDTTRAPRNTNTIRVRLIATRIAGTNNDGYFDNLMLFPITPQVTSVYAAKPRQGSDQASAGAMRIVTFRNGTHETKLSVPRNGRLNVSLLSLNGRIVQSFRQRDECLYTWDGSDASGNSVAAGVYYVRIAGAGFEKCMQFFKK